jgi:nicotinamidase-related amidase
MVEYLFRTPPDIDLQISGPVNQPKDGIYALTGIIETGWSPYTTTMNWSFTRTGRVRFNKGEPFAQITPVASGLVSQFEARFEDFATDPEGWEQTSDWRAKRTEFNRNLAMGVKDAVVSKWQKHYYRGIYPDGKPCPREHNKKLDPRPFENRAVFDEAQQKHPFVDQRIPVCAVIKAESDDWRLDRAIDEAATRAAEVLVISPTGAINTAQRSHDTPYQNVRFVEIGEGAQAESVIRENTGQNVLLLLLTTHLIRASLWQQMEELANEVARTDTDITVPITRSKTWFYNSVQLESFLANGSAQIDGLSLNHCLLTSVRGMSQRTDTRHLPNEQVIIA